MLHATRREEPIGDALQLVGAPAEHDDLEAVIVIEMHVERRANAVAEVVLDVVELLAEVAHVMIVDERQRGDGGYAATDVALAHFGAHEIA